MLLMYNDQLKNWTYSYFECCDNLNFARSEVSQLNRRCCTGSTTKLFSIVRADDWLHHDTWTCMHTLVVPTAVTATDRKVHHQSAPSIGCYYQQ